MSADVIIDGFAGPGGWSEGLRMLGLTDELLSAPRLSPALIRKRFERRVLIAPGGCWEWNGVRTARGYGRVRIGKREFGAHRVALVIATGQALKPGEQACHRCDNPSCVNPAHLFAGDAKANVRDMDEKGRRVIVPNHGEANGQAKLTEANVRWIRAQHGASVTELAQRFNVSTSLIRQIKRGDAWRWVA